MKIKEYVLKNKVREYRLKHSISQRELADAVSVSRNTINTIEHSDVDIGVKLAMKLCLYFGVPYEELFRMEKKNEK